MISTPIPLISTPQALTGSLVVAGTPQALQSAVSLLIWATYVRNAASTTGCLRVRVQFSPDATSPAWYALPVYDPSTLTSTGQTAYASITTFGPSVTGTSYWMLPEMVIRAAAQFQIQVCDLDGTNPGSLAALRYTTGVLY